MIRDFISALLSSLLSPASWLVTLIFLYFFLNERNRWRRRLPWIALCIFLVFSNSWLLNAYARYWQPAVSEADPNRVYTCAIILGGFASPLANDSGYFNMTSDRFIQTLKLYQTGRVSHIMIAGGNSKSKHRAFDEGAYTRQQFIAMGVPDSVILHEDFSSNTAENAAHAKAALRAKGLPGPYLLVTSAQHLPRAELLFRRHGLDVLGVPSAFIAGTEKFDFSGIVPRLDVLLRWDVYIKETLAVTWYRLRGEASY